MQILLLFVVICTHSLYTLFYAHNLSTWFCAHDLYCYPVGGEVCLSLYLLFLAGGEDRFEVDQETGVVRTKLNKPFHPGKEYEIGVSVEDINAPTLQKSMTYSLKILVGERNPQFYETQYKATVPETAPEGFEYVSALILSLCLVNVMSTRCYETRNYLVN